MNHLEDDLDRSLHPGTVQPSVVQECVQSIHLFPDVVQDTPVVICQSLVLLFQTVKLFFVVIDIRYIRVDVLLDLTGQFLAA